MTATTATTSMLAPGAAPPRWPGRRRASGVVVGFAALVLIALMLAPIAPHICEEINENLGYAPLDHAPWPVYDESALVDDEVEFGIQINGKVRGRVTLSASLDPKAIEAAALACEEIQPFLEGKTVRKVIVVKNIVNIVVG